MSGSSPDRTSRKWGPAEADDGPGIASGDERDRRPFVVHVSGDFPDPFVPEKTPVIRSLLDLTKADFRHQVVSLNRVSPGLGDVLSRQRWHPVGQPFAYGQALQYAAPARGILHARMLRRLGDYLAEQLGENPPDVLVGHKLTIEGLAVAHAANRLGVPYALSVQGNTDTKIVKARPDLRGIFARVYHEASVVFPFTPWARAAIEDRLGARSGPTTLLPCPTDLDAPLAPSQMGDGLISVFHLRHYRNKNLAGLAAAYASMPEATQGVGMAIVGGGTPADQAACTAAAKGCPGIVFDGALSRTELRQRLNRATGFVLPSFRESFGLVFIEALFAGLPIIYPKGAAIDGFFDNLPFAIGVDVRDRAALSAAMTTLVREERGLKALLREWQCSDDARQFMRPAIARRFGTGLQLALADRTTPRHSTV